MAMWKVTVEVRPTMQRPYSATYTVEAPTKQAAIYTALDNVRSETSFSAVVKVKGVSLANRPGRLQ